MICSKKDFDAYLEVQQSGIINMAHVHDGIILTGLSEEKYKDIFKKYKDIFKKYKYYKEKYYGNK